MVANLKNLIMMRNMRKKSTRFSGGNDDINDLAFAILSYDDDKTVGRFTYCNKIASKIFGVTEERIIGECVLNIMPELVRVNHEMFIKRF
jgi:PAS domain-containing protein